MFYVVFKICKVVFPLTTLCYSLSEIDNHKSVALRKLTVWMYCRDMKRARTILLLRCCFSELERFDRLLSAGFYLGLDLVSDVSHKTA